MYSTVKILAVKYNYHSIQLHEKQLTTNLHAEYDKLKSKKESWQ